MARPRWRLAEAATWPRLWEATPRREYFDAPRAEFDAAYLAQLAGYGPARIAAALEKIAREHQAENLILMCFEADPAECHRGTFADYWLTTTGEKITEVP